MTPWYWKMTDCTSATSFTVALYTETASSAYGTCTTSFTSAATLQTNAYCYTDGTTGTTTTSGTGWVQTAVGTSGEIAFEISGVTTGTHTVAQPVAPTTATAAATTTTTAAATTTTTTTTDGAKTLVTGAIAAISMMYL